MGQSGGGRAVFGAVRSRMVQVPIGCWREKGDVQDSASEG